MVLNDFRPFADRFLVPIAKKLKAIPPNGFSLAALLFAILGGYYVYSSHLLIALFFIFLNALCDALDGKVARMTKNLTKWGDFVDHVVDRYSDVIILVGFSFSIYSTPFIGMMAIIGVLMTSYMGTQIQASGAKRDYGGMMGRADRLVFIMAAIFAQVFAHNFGISTPFLYLATILFAVLVNLTAVQRFYRAWKTLSKIDK